MMNLIKEITQNIGSLDNFIEKNSAKILDFFQQDYNSISTFRNDIENLVSLNHIQLKNLDTTKYSDFILLILETCEKLGLEAEFLLLFNILKGKNIPISNRLIASSLFLTKIKNSDAYLKKYDEFLKYLLNAYELEEDNEEKIVSTFINYYSQALSYWGEFNKKVVYQVKQKILESIKSNNYPFLKNQQVTLVLNLDIEDFTNTYNKVKEAIFNILGINYLENIEIYNSSQYLIESDTIYASELVKINTDFLAIRDWNKTLFLQLENRDKLFEELRRGVHILETLEQLIAYTNSYGVMHYYKLEDAIKNLTTSFYKENIEIIDWACGQGFASMVYLSNIKQVNTNQKINKFTLIEPSLIALKRASLHIKHFQNNAEIITLNKDLNELFKTELFQKTSNTKLHFFSNILDIDTYSLCELAEYVNNNFKGNNYFIIVSPFIPNSRKIRINEFVHYFKDKSDFKLLYSIDNQKGEWKNNWSRMIRVFKVKIE